MIGVVVRSGRFHRINIGSSQLASLPELAFEGATKRNKVTLQVRQDSSRNTFYAMCNVVEFITARLASQ